MLQDVAVPHVLVPAGSRAGRNGEGHLRQVEPHDHGGHLARIHAHRLLPPQLGPVRTTRRTGVVGRAVVVGRVERLACQHLDIDQVEVDRVGVPRQVGDLPDLGFARLWRLGRRVHVGAPEAAIHRPVCPEQLEQAAVSIKGLVEGQLPDLHARRQVQQAVLDRRTWWHEEQGEVRRQIGVVGDAQGRVLAGRGDDREPEDLAGVRPEAWGRLGGIIWGTREVVVERVAHREQCGGIVVEDDPLPGEPAEIDEEVPALSWGGDEAAAEGDGIERVVGGDVHWPG